MDIVEPINGMIHGPFLPLTEEEISSRETHEYGRSLSEYEKIVLQGMHQYSQRGWAYTEAGETDVAEPFHYHAQRIHLNILNAGNR